LVLERAGTEGDDDIRGFASDDILDGGSGNDHLAGGDGNDTYVFDLGYGQDVVFDQPILPSSSRNDAVRFGDAIVPDNIELRRSDDDLVIAIAGTTDRLTLRDYFNVDTQGEAVNAIEMFHFGAGGPSLAFDDISRLLEAAAGTGQRDEQSVRVIRSR
jgi:Ca2+-binding RTX toxin-like protein